MLTTRVKFLAGVLALSVLFLIYDTFQRSSAKPKSATPQSQVSMPEVAPPESPESGTRRNVIPSSARVFAGGMNPLEGWGRNPFLKPVAADMTKPVAEAITEKLAALPPEMTFTVPELTVSAITWASGQAKALINGRILGVGDVIEGMLIMDIEEASVTFRGGGKTLTLEVGT
ncbi:MAG: hypothetical protein V3U24_03990 [Candidatus Neomarinimicrobiota bacterium]